jgi:CDP-2,3-bis-(O-geranylgeranyl)-sn-glycerol synthase
MAADALLIAAIVAHALWLAVPAMVPNSIAAIVGGGPPMDGGRTWKGKRILGPGKTWQGFIGGVAGGTLIGTCQAYGAHTWVPWEDEAVWWGFGPTPRAYAIVFTLALGSLLGDAAGSFYKRRKDLARGEKAPLLDQWNFLVGAWALTAAVHFGWFLENFVLGLMWLGPISVLLIVLGLHRLTNIIGYKMGQKDVPW